MQFGISLELRKRLAGSLRDLSGGVDVPDFDQEWWQSLVFHLQTEAHLVVDHAERSQFRQNGEQPGEVGARCPVLIHISSQRVNVKLLNFLHLFRVVQIWSFCG